MNRIFPKTENKTGFAWRRHGDNIKQELHQLIDQCNNTLILEDARELLQSGKDWWNEMGEKDKNLVLESEGEYNKGNFISHDELMKGFEAWKMKSS